MIKDIRPEVLTNMHVIAKEEVKSSDWKSRSAMEAKLAKDKEQTSAAEDGPGRRQGELPIRRPELQCRRRPHRLANRFNRYKTSEATLASLQKLHDARLKGLAAARQQLDGMLAQQRQLQVEVENLEARNQMVAAAQTTSNYQFDDSRLAGSRNWSKTWRIGWTSPKR